jgi:16S rRNA (guanine527-N7)-methyltransferase
MDLLLSDGLAALCREDRDIEEVLAGRMEMVLSRLDRYVEEIELFNAAYGLVGAADRRELVIKHILDSLAPLGILRRLLRAAAAPRCIADVGSGAGLPGIPLAIAFPEVRFTLIERMGRRAGFLRNCLALLGLSNAEVEEQEMEKAAPDRFSLIVFRAFRPLEPVIARGLSRLLAEGGILAAYKGRKDKIAEEMEAVRGLVPSWEVYPLLTPFLEEERHLVVMRFFTACCSGVRDH